MLLYFILPALLWAGFIEGARTRYDDDQQIVIKELRDSLDDLKREIRNQESEMKAFAERNNSVDMAIDSIRTELKETHQAQKEISKNNLGQLEMKIGSLETANKGLAADVKQIRGGFNDSQETLKAFKDRINQLEKSIEALNRNVEHLEKALNNVMDAFKVEAGNSGTPTGSKIYKVKAGDSLEKIAKQNGVTVRAIKELNGLTKDQIHVGQTLKLAD